MGDGTTETDRVHARSKARQSAPAQQAFTQEREGKIHPGMDPNGLIVRESRDSAEHPESIAAAFIMDITGSMGGIPLLLATEIMHEFMPGLARTNPHVRVLFGSVGDADDGYRSEAPWQIGQFETSDELADQWLTRTWLGGSGGSRPDESYDLGIYFLGYHTSIDCWEKRRKRGYAFITGDDTCRKNVKASTVNRLLGREELEKDIPIQTAIAKAAEMYHLFFLIPDVDRSNYSTVDGTLVDHWRKVLGSSGTVIVLADPHDTAVVSSILFGITEGAYGSLTAILEDLEANFQRKGESAARVMRAVSAYAESLGIVTE